ncbi:hypothetical protein FIV41_22375 [Pseudomonas marginalis]|uniref:Uncharacterized protein n=1 Tax=Pseudomonas marginalis TaxID=298 RepID=A0A9X9FW32_PSEMA|nr:hypothetical protein [Pseudomonas marginalis]TWR54736.1 hypothetical protein FIV41_22375 [Pseudomonas marginalis]
MDLYEQPVITAQRLREKRDFILRLLQQQNSLDYAPPLRDLSCQLRHPGLDRCGVEARKTLAMFMHYVHTEDKPVLDVAELMANWRKRITGAEVVK